MILIAYDGSEDSKAAITQAGKLFQGEGVTVLTVWQRFIDTVARTGGNITVALDFDAMDADAERAATQTAQAGSELALEAGMEARPRTAVVNTTVADAILAAAADARADAVVCGSHGHAGLRSLMLGSVSRRLLHHAEIPVVVVPSPAVVAARAEHRARMQEG